MKRAFLICLLMVLILCFDAIATADESEIRAKLGYGFESGLLPGKDFVVGQLILGFKEGLSISGIEQASFRSGGKIVKRIESAILIEFPSDNAALDTVSALIARPEVSFIERNGFKSIPQNPEFPDVKGKKESPTDFNALSVSSDPASGYQWHQTVIRNTAALPVLSSTPPTVAVIDTGVDYTHPDLSGKVLLGKNCVENNMDPFDDNGHGTHVAGIIGAKAANGAYGEGICPNCKILAVKVLDSTGFGTDFDVACGMQYARKASTSPATKVLNMSLGGPYSALIASEVAAIKAAGKVLAASAGNDNSSDGLNYPGADSNTALRVMATEENDCRTWFSNFSPSVNLNRYNIAAPGWMISSTVPGSGYETKSGTSMASSVVAGTAALVWGELPALNRTELISRLRTYGKKISCGFAVPTKRVNVRNAIYGDTETAIIGRILDPATGRAPGSPTTPTTAGLYSGTTLLAKDKTNKGGYYEMTGLAAGSSLTLKGSKAGYMTSKVRTGIEISSGIVSGPFTDALPKSRAAGDAAVTIDWKNTQPSINITGCEDSCNGWELDLWVKLPDNTYIGWKPAGDLTASPFVKFFRDSYDDQMPMESIVIGSSAANGVYRVFSEKYPYKSSWNHSWTYSKAQMQVFTGTKLKSSTVVPSTCDNNQYWHLGNLTKSGISYTWSPVNICTNTMP
jgi:subtilisin family serine protease